MATEPVPPQTVDRLCQALAAGNFRTIACVHAKLPSATFDKYMEAGALEDGQQTPAALFRQRVLEAEARAEMTFLLRILRSGEIDALKWWLARRHPGRWDRKGAKKLRDDQRVDRELMRRETEKLFALLETDARE